MVSKVIHSCKVFLISSAHHQTWKKISNCGVGRERHLTSETSTKGITPEGKQAGSISVHNPLCYSRAQVSRHCRGKRMAARTDVSLGSRRQLPTRTITGSRAADTHWCWAERHAHLIHILPFPMNCRPSLPAFI